MRFRAILILLGLASLAPTRLLSQSALSNTDRARLAEANSLVRAVAKRVWPGWERTPFALLLVADSAEYLVGHPRPTSEFTHPVYDSVVAMDVRSRPRVFAPTLLATFPAVGGLSTIVVGTAERTGKSSSDWVLTLLHEHFHQWQYSLPDYYRRSEELDLAGGDSSGMWMLNYPFPYDSAAVQAAAKDLAHALLRALDTTPRTRGPAIHAVLRARAALAKHLTAAEMRYLEFQLWQEGGPLHPQTSTPASQCRFRSRTRACGASFAFSRRSAAWRSLRRRLSAGERRFTHRRYRGIAS